MANYNLYYADLAKSPLVVTEGATRGPTHSSSATPEALNVGSVVTPLLFYGDGVMDYGARVQQNLLNLLENFSAPTAPGVAVTGQLWHDATNDAIKFWNGTAWVSLLSSTNLSIYLPKSGGTMTGLLTLSGTPTLNLHAATKQYVDDAVVGAGTNILPLHNTFTNRNWFRGKGLDPYGGSECFMFVGNEVTATTQVENAAVSTGVFLNGVNNVYGVGLAGRAFIQSGTGNQVWGAALEVWTYPEQTGTLVGCESSLVNQYNDNSNPLIGVDIVFKNRGDGVAATTMPIGTNRFNNQSAAITISGQTSSINGEYCGWATGVQFNGMSRTIAQERAHLVDFYNCILDHAGVEPLILSWKDRTSSARHGIFYNTSNGALEFWRDIYGTAERVGFWSFESGARDFDVVNGAVSKAGGDNINTDLSFSPSAPSIYRPGMVWHNSTTGNLSLYNGTIAAVDSTILTQAFDTTVANGNTELPILGTGWGGANFPANFFTIGKTINVKIVGRFSSAATETFRVRFKLGTGSPVLLGDTGAVVLGTNVDVNFSLEFMFTCRTIGPSGTFIGQGHMMIGNTIHQIVMLTPVTVNTTESVDLSVTGQWGAANLANSITTTNALVHVHA